MTMLVGGAGALVLMSLIVVAALIASKSDDPNEATVAATGGHQEAPQVQPPAQAARADPELTESPLAAQRQIASTPAPANVDDDGHTLWASPTAGRPLTVNYLPAGTQVLLVLRPSELLKNEEGGKLIDALGPGGQWAQAELRSILGVELEKVEQLQIAFFADESDGPQAAFVMQLPQAVSEATLVEAWGNPPAKEHKSKRFYQGRRFAYYLPGAPSTRLVAIAPTAAMQEIAQRDGPGVLRKEMERLLRDSDDARHFNLLVNPSYLLTDGRSLLAGDLEQLREPLAAFFEPGIQAVLFSGQFGDELFLECRAVASVEQRPQQLAEALHGKLEKVPEALENYLASIPPQPYGRLVINRFPRMVQLLSDFTRSGVENQQAVLRCYLPGIAAHNLLLGVQLTLFERGSPASGSGSAAPRPRTAAAALAMNISLSFPRDTLERCVEMLSKEIDQEVVILGSDLQLEGITKNQSFGLDERDQPAGDILRKVLKLANPGGRLVYVIKRDASGHEAIFITTRNAAAKRGDPLPPELAAESSSQSP